MKISNFFLLALLVLGLSAGPVVAQTSAPAKTKHHHSWSKKAKGAAIGGGAGAVTGAVVGGGKGAVVGGVVGAAAGGLIGKHKDKKKDPERYQAYKK